MMDLVALCMTIVMIYHVKTKYTAVGKQKKKEKKKRKNLPPKKKTKQKIMPLNTVSHNALLEIGRKEITMFFQLYLVTIFLEMLLVTNIIPTASILYPVTCNLT